MLNLNDKKYFMFDMDGTLINLEGLNKQGYSNTVKEYFNLNLSKEDYQKYFSGTRTAKGFNGYLESVRIREYNVDELITHFRKQKRRNLIENFDNCVSLVPGAKEYLRSIKDKGKNIALATSTVKEFVDIIIDKTDIRHYFDVVITAEDISIGKPNPEIFLLTLKRFNGNKTDAVIFEDSKSGIEAALASKMDCVGVHTAGLNDDWVNSADYVLESFEELLV